jgi:hypothetical protein
VSAACEERALRLLDAACGEALAGFPTTLAEDDALLHGGRLGTNARSAVVMRRGEKQVLSAYRDLARACIPLLQSPERAPTLTGGVGGYLFEEALRAVRDDPWSVLARAERGLRLNGRPLERAVAWRSPRS